MPLGMVLLWGCSAPPSVADGGPSPADASIGPDAGGIDAGGTDAGGTDAGGADAGGAGPTFKSVTFGFNITPLAHCAQDFTDGGKCGASLQRVHRDGIRDLRAMPLLPCRTLAGRRPSEMVKGLVDFPSRWVGPGRESFRVLVVLGDFPYPSTRDAGAETYPDPQCNAQSPELDIDLARTWLSESAPYYGSLSTDDKADAKRTYLYHNVFPPRGDRYFNVFLPALLSEMTDGGPSDKFEFEIHNEPDAPKYFSGFSGEFTPLLERTQAVLAQSSLKHYCCGLTTRYVARPVDKPRTLDFHRALDFHRLLDPSSGMGFSFHYYQSLGRTFPADLLGRPVSSVPLGTDGGPTGYSNEGTIFLPPVPRMITEFNIGLLESERFGLEFHTPAVVFRLAELLAFSYEHDIQRVYLFKLQDIPPELADGGTPACSERDGGWIEGEQLGFFDFCGDPKPAYLRFREVLEVVRDGFHTRYDSRSIDITGRRLALHAARTAHDFAIPDGGIVIGASGDGGSPLRRLEEKDWVLYRLP